MTRPLIPGTSQPGRSGPSG